MSRGWANQCGATTPHLRLYARPASPSTPLPDRIEATAYGTRLCTAAGKSRTTLANRQERSYGLTLQSPGSAPAFCFIRREQNGVRHAAMYCRQVGHAPLSRTGKSSPVAVLYRLQISPSSPLSGGRGRRTVVRQSCAVNASPAPLPGGRCRRGAEKSVRLQTRPDYLHQPWMKRNSTSEAVRISSTTICSLLLWA
jgi:hypothetical protein